MATKRRRKNKNKITVLFFLLLIVAAGVICYLVWDNYFRDKREPVPEPTTTQQTVNNPIIIDEKRSEEKKDPEPVEEKTPVQYDGGNPNTASGITGVITYAGVSGSNLLIRLNIDQYLNGGTCTLKLSQNGSNIYSATAPVIDAASTSTCEGFNVPVAGLPKGNINILIVVTSAEKGGEISGSVTL